MLKAPFDGNNNNNNNIANDSMDIEEEIRIKKDGKVYTLRPNNNFKVPFVWKDESGNNFEQVHVSSSHESILINW